MRVVAGTLSGRRFSAPEGLVTRPTTDRTREAIFNALGSLHLVRGALVADLYAGSGGLGIEALSRGAAHVTFVERQRDAVAVIRSNLDELGLADRSKVVAADALTVASGLDVDLVLADPPYGFEQWPELLGRLSASVVVAEADRAVEAPDSWEVTRTKRYGRSWVTFLARIDDDGASGDHGASDAAG